MGFEQRFRKKNAKLATSSVRTYLANIRRLARALGHDSIPEKGKWLKDKKVIAWLKKQTLNTKKLLSAAGVKAAQLYGEEVSALVLIMEQSSRKYDAERSKQKKTKREKILMPKGGYSSIHKAAAKLRDALPKEAKSNKQLMQLQDAWLLSFFAKHTPRLINDVQVGKGHPNRIEKVGKGYKITLTKHKTAKSIGPSTIKLDKSLNEITTRLLEARKRLVKHNYLLSASRGGIMSKSQLSQRLTKITSETLGRGFSTQILRVLKATSSSADMKKVREYLSEMGHSLAQEKKYVAK